MTIDEWLPGFKESDHKDHISTYTKDELIQKLSKIQKKGWITLTKYRRGRDGGFGNTLEDLLNIRENNIPLADYGEYELKTHRSTSNSLISLFRFDPWPRPSLPNLVENYGWPIEGHGPKEKSLRVDMDAASHAERGFIVEINEKLKRVEIHFDSKRVPKKPRYEKWLQEVQKRVGLADLNPTPYWTYADLDLKVKAKIKNMVYVIVDPVSKSNVKHMKIASALLLQGAELSTLLNGLREGWFQIEFNARTGHNHGTGFRTWEQNWPKLYTNMERLL